MDQKINKEIKKKKNHLYCCALTKKADSRVNITPRSKIQYLLGK